MRPRTLIVSAFLIIVWAAAQFQIGWGQYIASAAENGSTTYHVTIEGDDDNPGTEKRPFRTIQKAVDKANAGDTIYVHSGTYNDRITVTNSGTETTPLLISAFPGEQPIIDGEKTIPSTNEFTPLVKIAANNIIFSGFEVRNSAGRGVTVIDTQNVILSGLNVHHNWKAGITILSSSRVVVEDSDVWQNIRARKDAGIIGGSALVFIETKDSVARRNLVHENYGEGLVAGRFTERITLEDNVMWDNSHANLYLLNTVDTIAQRNLVYCTDNREFWRTSFDGTLRAGNGLILQDEEFALFPDAPVSQGRVVINNIVAHCGLNFAVWSQLEGGGLKGALIAYNTFVEARGEPGATVTNVIIGAGVHENGRIENNIILQFDGNIVTGPGASDPGVHFSHNLYSQPVPAEWRGEGDIVGDPQLINLNSALTESVPNAEWYKLQATSPAIDAAKANTEVKSDFFGEARSSSPDIGAHEFQRTANDNFSDPNEGENDRSMRSLNNEKTEAGSVAGIMLISLFFVVLLVLRLRRQRHYP